MPDEAGIDPYQANAEEECDLPTFLDDGDDEVAEGDPDDEHLVAAE